VNLRVWLGPNHFILGSTIRQLATFRPRHPRHSIPRPKIVEEIAASILPLKTRSALAPPRHPLRCRKVDWTSWKFQNFKSYLLLQLFKYKHAATAVRQTLIARAGIRFHF